VLWEIVAQLAKIPTWFHPLAWFAVRRLRIEREVACDDAVLLSGVRPADYAEQLVEVASELRSPRWNPAPVVAIAGASPIERRIHSILDPRTWRAPLGRWRTIAVTSLMASLIIVVAALSPTDGQEKGKTSDAQSEHAPAVRSMVAGSSDASAEIAAAGRKIADELDKTTTLHFDNVPLEEALLALSKRHGVPIQLEFWSFIQRGVVLAPRVTVNVERTTLRQALASLAESASGGAKIEAGVRVKDGVIGVGAASVEEWQPGQSHSESADGMLMVRGNVHMTDGKPAVGCEIIVRKWTQTILLCANDQGAFELPIRASQSNQSAILMRSASGREQATFLITDVVSPDKRVEPLNVTLGNTRTITVVVTDSAGKPVASAHTAITGGNGGAFDSVRFNGLTNDLGEFSARVPEKMQIGTFMPSGRARGSITAATSNPPGPRICKSKRPRNRRDQCSSRLARGDPSKSSISMTARNRSRA
jgi:hypothetical protein